MFTVIEWNPELCIFEVCVFDTKKEAIDYAKDLNDASCVIEMSPELVNVTQFI